jgi:ketosteroid isomerase-like protein
MSASLIPNAFQALASLDPDRISAVFTDDAEWLSPPENAVAVALEAPHHMVGRTAIARFFAEDFPRLFARDVAIAFHGMHAHGERVTVEATMTATLANGTQYVNDYCFVFELRDGLIHRVREYVDTACAYRMIFGDARPMEVKGPAGA